MSSGFPILLIVIVPLLFLTSIMLVSHNTLLPETGNIENIITDEKIEPFVSFSENIKNVFETSGDNDLLVVISKEIAGLPLITECKDGIGVSEEAVYGSINVYNNVAEGLNSEYRLDLPLLSSSEVKRLFDVVEKYSIACYFIDDYNNMVLSARKLEPSNRESYFNFTFNLMNFALDIFLVKENLAYKIAYKTVGKIAWETGAIKIIGKYGGKTALKTLLSISHWEMRKIINNYIDTVTDLSDETIEKLLKYIK